jgi:hypothetical protein
VKCLIVKRAMIEVNGVTAQGEILAGRGTAILILREKGETHSYLLLAAGDVDSSGHIGEVVDCGNWVAPHLPILLETRNHRPCLPKPNNARREPLLLRGAFLQFVGKDKSTISVAF